MPDGDNRGFVQHDALVSHEDQGVGGAQVNRQVGRDVPTESSEHQEVLSRNAAALDVAGPLFSLLVLGPQAR
jgi:hypothetical protein